MMKISFVILHYLDLETTMQCVESINNNIEYSEKSIIIVDNGSPNGSGEELQKIYKDNSKVMVILSKVNNGFAKGNNIGYIYAREKQKAEFIIVTNNDTIFEDSQFVKKMIEAWKRTDAYIMGPDIVTPSNIHQNPHRMHILSKKEAQKMLWIKSIFLYYFKIKRALKLDTKIMILEKWYDKKDTKNHVKKQYSTEMFNVVLQGACLIYTPHYIEKEKEAFCPETFMYGEEDLLAYKCKRKNYRNAYIPEISVYHLNGETTKKEYGEFLEKNIFTYKYIVEGIKILLKKMGDKNEHL